MAELILTEAEKAAALWSDLDDDALGKLVKKKIAHITDTAAQLDQITTFAAAMMLCLAAHEVNAGKAEYEFDGLSAGGAEIGDWLVTAQKRNADASPATPAEDARDGARYRFLRNQTINEDMMPPKGGVFIGLIPQNLVLTHEHADQWIDAALATKGEK